jgi:hypothetical protein
MTEKYLKIDDCVQGGLYEVDARNFKLGVYNKEQQGFIGIRYKFGSEFLDLEFHWDTGAPYGTVKPIEYLEECPHEAKDEKNPELLKWLLEKREEYSPTSSTG